MGREERLAGRRVKLRCRETVREVEAGGTTARLNGRTIPFGEIRRGADLETLEIDGIRVPVRVAQEGDRVFVWCRGETFEFRRAGGRASSGSEQAGELVAPMPGRIARVAVTKGQRVERGAVVLVLEAMKMEHAIRAPRDGVVLRILHAEGELVDAGAALVEIG